MKCPTCARENPENTRFCGQCGRDLTGQGTPAFPATLAYDTPTKGLDRGTTFARRFEIIEEIGKGGMGTVYKAYDTRIREVVALKLLKPEIAADLEIIDRFRNELKLARKVAHRHVCRMYDLSEEGQAFYISMEFVAGEDLKSFIRRAGPLNEAKALDLSRQIAEGLGEAHRQGVVHRDLKPHNIMIDREGSAKIMDFGIARSLNARGLTAAGLVIGTPEYMSPEQAEARAIDHRSDIYSFGVIMYEMVTGRVPFEGETPLSIALRHRTEAPRDPRDLNAQVSQGFSRVILRCLEKNREDRYQSAGDLLADLDKIGKGLPVAAAPARARRKPITSREFTVKFSLRRLLVPGLAVIIVVLGVLLFIRSQSSRQIPSEGERAASFEGGIPPSPKGPPVAAGRTGPGRGSQGDSGIVNKAWDLVSRYVKDKDLQGKDARELNKALDELKKKLPPDTPLNGLLDKIQTEIAQGEKLGRAGNPEGSLKSYSKGESEMKKLLSLVSEREKADQAKIEMDDAKKRAHSVMPPRAENLLSWIAGEKEKDAAESYAKNDFAGARILYGILTQVHLLSMRGGDENQCLASLQEVVKASRDEAEKVGAPAKQEWLFSRAREDEASAAALVQQKDYASAAETCILAAFLYDKAREVTLESAVAVH